MSINFCLTKYKYFKERGQYLATKKGLTYLVNPFFIMVGTMGFEPMTSTVSG